MPSVILFCDRTNNFLPIIANTRKYNPIITVFASLVNTINCNVSHRCAPDKQHPKYINPYLIMFGSAESLEPLNNPQCKQQMLDGIEGEMDGECLLASDATPAVPAPPPRSHPPVSPWHVTLASLHNDEAALLLSPRIITCDRRTDAQFFWVFLVGFSFFFPTFSARICLWLQHPSPLLSSLSSLSRHAFTGLIHLEPFRRI